MDSFPFETKALGYQMGWHWMDRLHENLANIFRPGDVREEHWTMAARVEAAFILDATSHETE